MWDQARERRSRYAGAIKAIKLAPVLVVAVSLVLAARALPVAALVRAVEGWVHGLGPWGPLAFGLVYVVAVVALIPASALTLAAGALFGLVAGTVTASVASTTGAALAFLIARHLARGVVESWVREDPRFAALDRAIGASDWKVVALLRLSPAVPFNLQNSLYGLTAARFWPTTLASWATMLPGTFLYVYLGHVGRAGLDATSGSGAARSPAEWGLTAAGLLATVAATAFLTRLARRVLRQRAALPADPPPAPRSPET